MARTEGSIPQHGREQLARNDASGTDYAANLSAVPLRKPEPPAPRRDAKPSEGSQATNRGGPSQGGHSGWSKRSIFFIVAAILVVGGLAAWWFLSGPKLPRGFAAGNGRLEANEIYVATKYPGRVKDILFNEGDMVEAGQVVARMDTSALDAQLQQASAQITEAQDSRNVALAQVQVKQADYDYAGKQYQRSKQLVTRGAVSEQEAEIDAAKMQATRAELVGARAEAVRSLSSIDAAKATADRIRAEIKDAVLVAPVRARVETRLTEPGEVLPQGGRVFLLVDLSDVYMYVYLPTSVTGKIRLGSEGRIVLDALPQFPIKTYVSYVSAESQFTPKTVETAEERHDLTFRVKLQLDKERLRQFEPFVKSGLPGMGYVRSDPSIEWPQKLQVKSVTAADLGNATGSSGPK
jgi:HlyD family secretion protein